MKKIIFVFTLSAFSLTACNFSASSSVEGSKGISISENGLSVSEEYLADGIEKTDDRTFRYGQKVFTNFVDMQGFLEEDEMIYPQMAMFVISKKGDTIMQQHDLFGMVPEGIDAADKSMNGHMILARPIYSGSNYELHYQIEDSRGNASLTSKMDFELVADSNIKVVANGLTYTEAYIYSEDKDEVITDGTFNFFENLRFDIQDLDGYVKKDGAVHLGMNVKVIDDDDNEILNMDDLFKDPILDEALLKQGVSATLIIQKGNVANPLKWQVEIWDKNSDAKLRALAEISVKK